MSRSLASILFAFCLVTSACNRPQAQPIDCGCAAAPPAVSIEFRAAQDSLAPGYTPMTLTRSGMSETVFVSETVSLSMADVAGLVAARLVQAGTVVAEIGEVAMITGSLTEDECCAIACAFRATPGAPAAGT